jgi:hypothetical protein
VSGEGGDVVVVQNYWCWSTKSAHDLMIGPQAQCWLKL